MLISDLDYSDYLGRLCIGRIINGSVKSADQLVKIGEHASITPLKVTKIQTYQGISIAETPKADCGEIVILSGVEDVKIGDTIAAASDPRALPRLSVDEPTVSINFYRNSGPFAGQEGKWVALGKVLERLQKEALRNVAIKVDESQDRSFICVKGRGEFQLAIIIESLRREGYEFCVARPQVIYHNLDGVKQEPIESLYIECGGEYTGAVTEKLLKRKCLMTNMIHHASGRALLEFSAPSRSLIGYRDEFLTDTKGTGIMNSIFSGYEEYRGDIPGRASGSLIADRQGEAIPYAIFNLEPRGKIFVLPNDKVYEGMIVGEHNRENDLNVNICKEKKLSNMRAAGKDDNIILTPFQPLTLESCLSFLRDDEWLEVTPTSLRMRKAALKMTDRKLWREED
jgi:GTP-binding protein